VGTLTFTLDTTAATPGVSLSSDTGTSGDNVSSSGVGSSSPSPDAVPLSGAASGISPNASIDPVTDALAAAGELRAGDGANQGSTAQTTNLASVASGLGLPTLGVAGNSGADGRGLIDALNALPPTAAGVPVADGETSAAAGFPVPRLTLEQLASVDGKLVPTQLTGQDMLFVYKGIQDPRSESPTSLVYHISPDTFGHTNPNSIVSLEVMQADGSPLPDWVKFNARSGTLSGTAPEGASVDIDVKVVAKDDAGRVAEITFRPILSSSSPLLGAALDSLSGGSVGDGVTASSQAANREGASQAAFQRGSGLDGSVPQIGESAVTQGFPVARVSAGLDGVEGETASNTGFKLFVFQGIESQTFQVGQEVDFGIALNAFAHTDPSAIVRLEARLADGAPLPDWLKFNALTGTFSGMPGPGDGGMLNIEIVARDEEGRIARAQFSLNLDKIVADTDEAPVLEAGDQQELKSAVDEELPEKEVVVTIEERVAPVELVSAKSGVQGDKAEVKGASPFTEQARNTRLARDPVLARILGEKAAEKPVPAPRS